MSDRLHTLMCTQHKAKVQEDRKKDREAMVKELYHYKLAAGQYDLFPDVPSLTHLFYQDIHRILIPLNVRSFCAI